MIPGNTHFGTNCISPSPTGRVVSAPRQAQAQSCAWQRLRDVLPPEQGAYVSALAVGARLVRPPVPSPPGQRQRQRSASAATAQQLESTPVWACIAAECCLGYCVQVFGDEPKRETLQRLAAATAAELDESFAVHATINYLVCECAASALCA